MTPPAAENITVPVAPENVTVPAIENVTAPVAPAPAVETNQTPVLNTLAPDRSSPQLAGTVVTWAANATDPDGDQILYRFFLNGPSTEGSWQSETEWGAADTWTWTTSAADLGENQIKVGIRDGKHAAEDSSDAEQAVYFTLISPTRNISGVVFDDKNGNAANDGEPGLAELDRPSL